MSRTGKSLRFHPTFSWHGCWEKTQTSVSEVQDSVLLTVIARYQPCFHWLPEPQFPQGDLRRARLHLHTQSVTYGKKTLILENPHPFEGAGGCLLFFRGRHSLHYVGKVAHCPWFGRKTSSLSSKAVRPMEILKQTEIKAGVPKHEHPRGHQPRQGNYLIDPFTHLLTPFSNYLSAACWVYTREQTLPWVLTPGNLLFSGKASIHARITSIHAK